MFQCSGPVAIRGDPELDRRAGHGACYLVAADETDVDRAHAAGLAAGATSHEAPNAPAHGGRQCTLRDGEGNLFTIGTYAGAGDVVDVGQRRE